MPAGRHPRSEGAGEIGLLAMIREDRRHHWNEVTRPGFQALAIQRLGHWAHEHPDTAFASTVLGTCRLLTRYVRYRFGIELAPAAQLGRRLSVGHQGGIAIGADVTMGDDCAILQGTRIGRVEGESLNGPGPRIGHRVHVGARAIVRGDLAIGDDAKIGPNAVITASVPAGATALARPSQVKRLPTTGRGVGTGAPPAGG
jgi:serine acetyltransferase